MSGSIGCALSNRVALLVIINTVHDKLLLDRPRALGSSLSQFFRTTCCGFIQVSYRPYSPFFPALM
jgi:hypothetical protein